jgi:hypothetical protein
MELTALSQILTHEEAFRAVCARVEDKSAFVVVANPDIDHDETNCVFRVRLHEEQVPKFLALAQAERLAVVLDAAATPPSLDRRLKEGGFVPGGRQFIAVLDPSLLVEPPGGAPRLAAVGPGELRAFTELAEGGAASDCREAARLLWSFRLRSLLVSAYLAEGSDGLTAAFAVFHQGPLARLLGPYPGGIRTEFVLACRLVAKAWERAREKDARSLYTLVGEADVDACKPLGFRVDESFWIERYSRGRGAGADRPAAARPRPRRGAP